ncbi:MAG TPA: hypothetical protein DCE44_18170 [Verrucomicrobiales bacterium]|nr:hypothetical protein [Verrucomicrobiales bacterium]
MSETGYLAALLFLSLVAPLLMSLFGPRVAATRTSCMKRVWTAQTLGALAAGIVLTSARVAPYAALFGLVSCIFSTLLLVQQFRAAGSK